MLINDGLKFQNLGLKAQGGVAFENPSYLREPNPDTVVNVSKLQLYSALKEKVRNLIILGIMVFCLLFSDSNFIVTSRFFSSLAQRQTDTKIPIVITKHISQRGCTPISPLEDPSLHRNFG